MKTILSLLFLALFARGAEVITAGCGPGDAGEILFYSAAGACDGSEHLQWSESSYSSNSGIALSIGSPTYLQPSLVALRKSTTVAPAEYEDQYGMQISWNNAAVGANGLDMYGVSIFDTVTSGDTTEEGTGVTGISVVTQILDTASSSYTFGVYSDTSTQNTGHADDLVSGYFVAAAINASTIDRLYAVRGVTRYQVDTVIGTAAIFQGENNGTPTITGESYGLRLPDIPTGGGGTWAIKTGTGNIDFGALKTTGAAGGKKTVCVDTATGRLYASSTGTDCSN